MDTVRQIRFVIPSFFLYASVLLGILIANYSAADSFTNLSVEDVFALGGALVAATLPLGFLIGAFSVIFLRIVFWLFTNKSYEFFLSKDEWNLLWPKIKTIKPFDYSLTLYAGVTFEHELLSPAIHDWITRRWNAFYVSVNSCTALMLAHFVGYLVGIPQTFKWYSFTAFLIVLFGVHATVAWSHAMNMIAFQSTRIKTEDKNEEDVSEQKVAL
jgi:hypothetical protein